MMMTMIGIEGGRVSGWVGGDSFGDGPVMAREWARRSSQ